MRVAYSGGCFPLPPSPFPLLECLSYPLYIAMFARARNSVRRLSNLAGKDVESILKEQFNSDKSK
jgi:hypothetical protein